MIPLSEHMFLSWGLAGMPKKKKNRHQTRDQVFAFIVEYKRAHDGLSPATGEIAAACQLHTSSVRYHLTQLQLEGRIRVVPHRGITIVGSGWGWEDEDHAPT